MEEERGDSCKPTVGVLGTYNQDWGITRYVNRLIRYILDRPLVVLAEDVPPQQVIGEDPPCVSRCWKRSCLDYSSLIRTALQRRVGVLHVNCCFPFFDAPEFIRAVWELRAHGVTVVAHVHDRYAFLCMSGFLQQCTSQVIVNCPSNKLEASAAGIAPSKVTVLECAVDRTQPADKKESRRLLSIPSDQQVVLCVDISASLDPVLGAIEALSELGPVDADTHLYVIQLGTPGRFSGGCATALQDKVSHLYLERFVHFVHDVIADSVISDFVAAADVLVINESRPECECRELLGIALACGTPVVAQRSLPLEHLEGAIIKLHESDTLSSALRCVLNNENLSRLVRKEALSWAARRDGRTVAKELERIYAAASAGSS